MASTLDGITVLDLTSGPAGALVTMFLSDHGARVTRVVDPQDTSPRRGGYLVWDRGKECLRLDLGRLAAADTSMEAAAARAVYERLLRGADVVVDDFAPSSPRQALVPFERLAALNPRLVHCSITAYGKQGPWKDEPPIDELVMARLGILGSQPGFRPPPVHVVHPLPTVGAALHATIGIAAALLAREQTGRGRAVATSLMAGALLYHPKVTGERLAPNTFQTHPSGSAPFYSVYECADGNWVQLGCVHGGFIAIAANVMGIKEILDEPRFGGGRMPQNDAADRELRGLVAQAIRTRPYDTWARLFEEADVPFAKVRVTEESMGDPQVQANGMVVELQDPEVGPVAQMGVPIHLSVTPGRVQGPRQLPKDPVRVASEAPAATSGETTFSAGPFAPPLRGIRVLEITNLIAGPTAGRLLADLGADVIKMESLDGDISRPIGRTYFFNVNLNKRSLSVNTRTPEGKTVAQKVAATADVLLANLRPGATERMGIGPDMLRQLNPRLIETHVTGYGWTGPYAHRPGIDPLAQALMGLERAQGGQGNPPVFPAQLAPTDFTAGAMGALGTILALFARARTGVVQRVDTNLLNGGIVLSSEWFTRYQGKPVRRLADHGQYGLDAWHRLYQLADGWLYLAADTPEARQAVGRLLDGEALQDSAATPPGVHPNETPLAQDMARRFAPRRLADTLARLRAAGVPCAPAVEGHSEIFLDDPHAAANHMIATHQHPNLGHMRVAWHYAQFGQTTPTPGQPTPLLGEHTLPVLREVGFTDTEIASLYAKGVVKTEEPAAAR